MCWINSIIKKLCLSCWAAYILQDDTRSIQYPVTTNVLFQLSVSFFLIKAILLTLMSHLKLKLCISPSPAHKISSLALGGCRIFFQTHHITIYLTVFATQNTFHLVKLYEMRDNYPHCTSQLNHMTCIAEYICNKLICKLHTGNGMWTLERPDTTWEVFVTPLDCVCLNAVEDRPKTDRNINIVPVCVAIIMNCQRPATPKQ